jgi:hypothetical protein
VRQVGHLPIITTRRTVNKTKQNDLWLLQTKKNVTAHKADRSLLA